MPPRRLLMLRSVALGVLVLVAGALLGAPAAAQHHHEGAGLYNPDCPLVALATAERQGGLVVTTASTPLVLATDLVVGSLPDRPAAVPTADVRFRAPPTR